ncbi:TraM recognition domain-containing protein [Clostridium sp.]|uniref:type IV secretory system conjugative DNA transfer family protein n=1 Tax=Clostridium sp. TaxID=1506 RepID=UPI0025B7BAC2|nr:TraM recognition domain-containing protein [Clostridium sp.]
MFEFQSNCISIIIAMSFVPIMTLIISTVGISKVASKWLDKHFKYQVKSYWYCYFISIVFLLLSIITKKNFNDLIGYVTGEAIKLNISSLNDMIKYSFTLHIFMFVIWGIIIGTWLLYRDSIRLNHNSEIIRNRKRKKERIEDWKKVPLDYKKNIFILGKNGAGKTVAISNFLKEHLNKNEFEVIIDGKGDVGKFSLYDIVTRLCLEKNRKLYIINQSVPEETHSYNPFKKCNATQIKDMLINMSEWSEEHYKALASEYFQALAQFMIDTEIEISFNSLIHYGMIRNFISELEKRKEFISIDEYEYYSSVISRCGEDVQGSVSRFSTIARGVGRKLFRDEKSFNLQQAYDEKAVVLVLLNNLEYTDFARGVGMLVLNDVKNVLGKVTKIKEDHEGFLCVYDELSVYFSTMLIDIVNKSRSLGGTNILATQTIADMDIIDEEARRIVINNMHGYYLLKQADDKSAETIAKAIGTKKATEITSKLDKYGKTGDGTSKIVDEFLINPNDLKTLPLEVGYWVDTMKENYKPIRVKFPYVDVSNLKEYSFTGNK